MDYETKIYLDNLIEAVEKLDSPDWWMIVLTVINIVAFILVAFTQIKSQKRQEKLQQQQISLSEYELNKQLYSVIRDIDELSDTFIMRVYSHFYNFIFVMMKRDILEELQSDIENVQGKLYDCILDIELKLNGDMEDSDSYKKLLEKMRVLVLCMKEIADLNAIDTTIDNIDKQDDKALQSKIISKINDDYKEVITHVFDDFVKQQDRVRKLKTLKKIKKRIEPISVK